MLTLPAKTKSFRCQMDWKGFLFYKLENFMHIAFIKIFLLCSTFAGLELCSYILTKILVINQKYKKKWI